MVGRLEIGVAAGQGDDVFTGCLQRFGPIVDGQG
jgi:hypothetical protein